MCNLGDIIRIKYFDLKIMSSKSKCAIREKNRKRKMKRRVIGKAGKLK